MCSILFAADSFNCCRFDIILLNVAIIVLMHVLCGNVVYLVLVVLTFELLLLLINGCCEYEVLLDQCHEFMIAQHIYFLHTAIQSETCKVF